MEEEVVQRFLRYVKINTQSNENSKTIPSSQGQFDLQKILVEELAQIGVKASVNEFCVTIAELPATNHSTTSIGFFCHVDTSPEAPAENLIPLFHTIPKERNQIESIKLPRGNTVIDKNDLLPYNGETIISSSGDTLLGADDKSGIAMVMTAIKEIKIKNIPHPRIVLVFTPDEEIGKSCNNINISELNLNYAYSVDGYELGSFNDEGFNAVCADLVINGNETHPGWAYQTMEDSSYILTQFLTQLPVKYRPENTKENEGYILCTNFNSSVIQASAHFIVRSFFDEEMQFFIQLMKDQCNVFEKYYQHSHLTISFKKQYNNIKKYLPGNYLTEQLVKAMELSNVNPFKKFMRGGGDCSFLSERGLPTINMFGGGVNFHSRREFIPIKALKDGAAVIYNLIQLF